ncbi:hypothetical protein HK102_010988 [Quaeritorhiza haematococci]|nr:hypothetical protein HK102_010988 [Quaeritorhiza haematococci]
MRTHVYNDKDFVIRKGEVGRAMFFIMKGEVQVISEDGESIINVMREGSFFGEIGLLFSVPRTASCRSRGRSVLLILTKEKLKKVASKFPAAAETIRLIAEERFASFVKQQEFAVKMDFDEELKLGITKDDLNKHPLFRDCEVGFLHMLSLTLKPVQYLHNDLLIKRGDKAEEMFFVVRGTAEVFNEDDGRVYAQFPPGSFFGEVGLILGKKRTASVRCVTPYIDVFKLTRNNLNEVLEHYPEVAEKIAIEARARYEYNEIREQATLNKTQTNSTELDIVRERLRMVPLFKDTSLAFLHQLALFSKVRVFNSGDIIIRKDEIADSMYFVIDGFAEVVSDNQKTIHATLPPNSFFGEVGLFFDTCRTATVRAASKDKYGATDESAAASQCTVVQLNKDALKKALASYPQLKQVIEAQANENFQLFQERNRPLVPMFKKCDASFLQRLALSTQIETRKPGEIVVSKGDDASNMFFVVRGVCEIFEPGAERVIDVIKEGDFFGEIGLIRGIKRTASVRASTEKISDQGFACILIVLSSKSLNTVAQQYPEAFQLISLESERRYQLAEKRRGRSKSVSGPADTSPKDTDKKRKASLPGNIDLGAFVPTSPKSKPSGSIGNLFRRRSFVKPAESEALDEQQASQDQSQDTQGHELHRSSSMGALTARPPTKQPPHTPEKTKKFGGVLKTLKKSLNWREDRLTKVNPEPIVVVTDDDSCTGYKSLPAYAEFFTPVRNILDFDREYTLHIFSFLDIKSKLVARGVCRAWNELITANSQLWKVINCHDLFRVVTKDALHVFCNVAGPIVSELNLTSCWQVYDDDLKVVADKCENLAKLCLSNCWKITDKGVAHFAQKSRKLQHLDLSYCGQLTGACFVDHQWTGLQSLDLTYCKHITDDQLEKLMCRTSHIYDLRMRRCVRITDYGLFLVVRYNPHLRSLDLGDCDQITDKCLKWIASSCYHLVDLNLRFCTKLSNIGLYDLSLGSQHFETLNLSYCALLTDQAIMCFSESISMLRHLVLKRCRKVTDRVAVFLAKSAPRLILYDVTDCPLVTGATRSTLVNAIPNIEIHMDESAMKHPSEEHETKRPQEVTLHERYTSVPKVLPPQPKHRRRSSSKPKAR